MREEWAAELQSIMPPRSQRATSYVPSPISKLGIVLLTFCSGISVNLEKPGPGKKRPLMGEATVMASGNVVQGEEGESVRVEVGLVPNHRERCFLTGFRACTTSGSSAMGRLRGPTRARTRGGFTSRLRGRAATSPLDFLGDVAYRAAKARGKGQL